MTPKQAWQTLIRHIQGEMAKSTFDSWVRDTHFVSFENGIFTVGAKNMATRDWLEGRLTSTVVRSLTGIMDQTVAVEFVVVAPSDQELAEIDESESDELSPEMTISIDRGIRDLFVKPDRALYFPGYWLRWIPYLGAKPFMTILAFRQALYQKENCFKEMLEFSISSAQVGKIIGVQRQTIARQRDSGKLTWFLSHRKTEEYVFGKDGIPNRIPHSYSFKQSPITPSDIDEILEWLLEHGLEKDPIKTLTLALDTQPREMITYPIPRPSKLQKKRQPGSANSDLLANILSHCGSNSDAVTRKEMIQLVEKLKTRILDSDGLVKVPLYYLNHLVPYLGITPALAGIYLRKKAFRNQQTGEIREEIKLKNGYKELSSVFGVSEKIIREFMPTFADEGDKRTKREKTEKQVKRAAWIDERRKKMQLLLLSIAKDNGDIRLRIATSDPLSPAHQKEYELAIAFASFLLEQADREEISQALDSLDTISDHNNNGTNRTYGNGTFQSIGNKPNRTMGNRTNQTISDGTFRPIGDEPNRTIEDGTNQTHPLIKRFTKSNDIKYLSFKYVDYLLLKDQILNLITSLTTLTTSPFDSQSQNFTWELSLGEQWEFNKLFKSCRIAQQTQEQFQENEVTSQAFISHLIYAYSSQGEGLNHKIRYAISQVLGPGDGDLGHGTRHDRLSSATPRQLQALLRYSLIEGLPSNGLRGIQDWIRVMGESPDQESLIELGEILGILSVPLT